MYKTIDTPDQAKPVQSIDNRIFFEAIALRKCIDAVYNGAAVTLAPYILYTRHDELFIDAVTVERNGKPPREVKLGTFKLVGLREARVTDRHFVPEPLLDMDDPKYAGVTLFTVEA